MRGFCIGLRHALTQDLLHRAISLVEKASYFIFLVYVLMSSMYLKVEHCVRRQVTMG